MQPVSASDEQLRAIYATVTCAVVVQDAAGCIVYANEVAQRILGLTAEQMLGRTSFDPFWRARREDGTEFPGPEHPAVIARLTGEPQRNVTVGMHLPNDEFRWLQVDAIPVLGEAGEVRQMVASFTDITARKRMEEALNASEARLRAVVSNAPIFLWAIDTRGIFTLCEGPALPRIGYQPGQLVGCSIWQELSGAPEAAADVRRALEGESVTTVRPYRGYVIETRYSPMRDQQGAITGLIGVGIDVTDRARAQEESARACAVAEEAAQLRRDFVASVSHELRTPLTAIVGFGELLLERWDQFSEGQRLHRIGNIVQAANRQQRLVEDLLLIGRIETASLAPKSRALPLAPLLQQAVAELQGSYPGQSILLDGPSDLRVHADAAHVTQVLVNLLDNAAKYSPEGSPITVRWEQEADAVAMRVIDWGSGVPDEGRDQLFTRFGRMQGSRIRAGRVGTGLGLYISRGLAEAMGGDLDLESTGPEGSTFRLRLPSVLGHAALSEGRVAAE